MGSKMLRVPQAEGLAKFTSKINPNHKGVVLPPPLVLLSGLHLSLFSVFFCIFQGLLHFDSSPTSVVC